MKFTIGFDIGGSSIKSVVYGKGKIMFKHSEDSRDITNIHELTKKLSKIYQKMHRQFKIEKNPLVGVAIAGVLDKKREIMLKSPNIPYLDGLNLRKIFTKQLKGRIFLENDANCFLIREKEKGVLKNIKSAFCLTLGTGIGGAILLNGEIYRGYNGAAGEIGHMIMGEKNNFEFEDLASIKLLKKHLNLGPQEVKKLADIGDKKALKVLKTFGENLGAGIANIINIYDPQLIIIGGGCAQLKKHLLPVVEKVVRSKIVSPPAKTTEIIFIWEGSKSIFVGAEGAAIMTQKK
ncbi:MAG: ROK family protein [Patescibacteria group bacterium]|nr:ROK family protein [Patescibacteria group bacterium]